MKALVLPYPDSKAAAVTFSPEDKSCKALNSLPSFSS